MLNIRPCTKLNRLLKVKRDNKDICEHRGTLGEGKRTGEKSEEVSGKLNKTIRRWEWTGGREEIVSLDKRAGSWDKRMKNVIFSARRVCSVFSLEEKPSQTTNPHFYLRLLRDATSINIYIMIVINNWQIGVTVKPRNILLWKPQYLHLSKLLLKDQWHIDEHKLKQSWKLALILPLALCFFHQRGNVVTWHHQ